MTSRTILITIDTAESSRLRCVLQREDKCCKGYMTAKFDESNTQERRMQIDAILRVMAEMVGQEVFPADMPKWEVVDGCRVFKGYPDETPSPARPVALPA